VSKRISDGDAKGEGLGIVHKYAVLGGLTKERTRGGGHQYSVQARKNFLRWELLFGKKKGKRGKG